jgi:hypothetical protein
MRKGRRDRGRATTALSSSYWREPDARRVLALWRKSGLSLKAFASREGIGRSRLQRWKTRLESETPTFHPVQVVFDAHAAARQVGSPGRVELVLGNGRRVAVTAGFDAAVLEELVRVVESWPC